MFDHFYTYGTAVCSPAVPANTVHQLRTWDRGRTEIRFKVAGIIYFMPYRLEIVKSQGKRCY